LRIATNSDRASPQDVEYLFAFADLNAPCRQIDLDTATQIHPAALQVQMEKWSERDGLLIKLVKREISWGDFARAIDLNNQRAHLGHEAAKARVREELQQSHAAELQRRAAAAQAMTNVGQMMSTWAYQQDQLNILRAATAPQYKPVITNCAYVGRMLSCTTY
jgi:hypothetical protein